MSEHIDNPGVTDFSAGLGDLDAITIDPVAFERNAGDGGTGGRDGGSDPSAGGSERKRRGRKPGTRNKTRASEAVSLEGVEAILVSLHQMAAMALKAPELSIEDEEAKKLVVAIQQVSRHYDTKISQKAVDWANLVGALGFVYGPRFYALHLRRKEEAAPKEVRGGNVQNVHPLNGMQYTAP